MSEKSKPKTAASGRARLNGTAFQRAICQWKVFLETTPPNTPLKIPGFVIREPLTSHYTKFSNSLPIELHCERDDGPRRFELLNKNVGISFPFLFSGKRNFNFINYQCRDCQTTFKTFAVLVERNIISSTDIEISSTNIGSTDISSTDIEVMKLGEYPPFSAPISSRIKKLLSESDLDLYRKGARAEAQGLGIGAATYFRRVVEGQWQDLVKKISEAAERLGEDLGVYDVALKETQFSKAVEMLSGAIPAKLLILGGENPLTLLYKPLSRQLHELTDEECLREAADIRIVLTALLENIADVLKNQDELHEAAKRLKARPHPTD